MLKLLTFLTICLLVACLNLEFANLASILANQADQLVQLGGPASRFNNSHKHGGTDFNSPTAQPSAGLPQATQPAGTEAQAPPTTASPKTQAPPTSEAATLDPNADPDDVPAPGQPPPPALPTPAAPGDGGQPGEDGATTQTSGGGGGDGGGGGGDGGDANKKDPKLPPSKTGANDTGRPTAQPPTSTAEQTNGPTTDRRILYYSVFIVYVSFVKLFYHNVHLIKHNLTEPGILMLFGIFWQLASRQISSEHEQFPRFNSRIFFYLFLPSTVLESASLLSNKWLFFNLLPILTHSIVGTVLNASALGFTISSLGRSNILTLNWMGAASGVNGGAAMGQRASAPGNILEAGQLVQEEAAFGRLDEALPSWNATTSGELLARQLDFETATTHEFGNLTLADCLIFGTILSSIEAAPMLTVFKQYQVNEKLYYLVLGENLMNNAVVIMIFHLLIDFFEATRLTVVKIYIAILQFFANLIGAVLIGFAMALFALLAVRLTKRFQAANHVLSNYQNQCQAMVETLLVLKLAYLTYTLASLAGTSSIVSLATFGILNDQYIKQNLNLRSQLAFRQVTLAMKTMGFSLVYPLLGMLLVDTALSGPHHHAHAHHQQQQQQRATTTTTAGFNSKLKLDQASLALEARHAVEWRPPPPVDLTTHNSSNDNLNERAGNILIPKTAAMTTAGKRWPTARANNDGSQWNFKFLSIVVILTIVYRFLIVVTLGLLGNVLTCGQIKLKFKEQILMAYGGFKGPLSIALVHSLIEHSQHKERMASNKHLFSYTILFNIFISAVLAGTFTRPLVARIQSTLIGRLSTNLDDTRSVESTMVFERINYKLTESVSHGLNSILGHSRSPYDKFLEFNETHIKRWLVRDGATNTNWLSTFYDNLVLDETLNANCFYIASEDPTTMRTLRSQQQQQQHAKQHHHAPSRHQRPRRRSSVGFLNPISELAGRDATRPPDIDSSLHSSLQRAALPRQDLGERGAARPSKQRRPPGGDESPARRAQQVGLEQAAGETTTTNPPNAGREGEAEALRELVLFNVKLDGARQRRHAQQQQQPQQQQKRRPRPLAASGEGARAPAPLKMIDSSTSGDELRLGNASPERRRKQAYLSNLETRLNADTTDGEPAAGLAGIRHANGRRPAVEGGAEFFGPEAGPIIGRREGGGGGGDLRRAPPEPLFAYGTPDGGRGATSSITSLKSRQFERGQRPTQASRPPQRAHLGPKRARPR